MLFSTSWSSSSSVLLPLCSKVFKFMIILYYIDLKIVKFSVCKNSINFQCTNLAFDEFTCAPYNWFAILRISEIFVELQEEKWLQDKREWQTLFNGDLNISCFPCSNSNLGAFQIRTVLPTLTTFYSKLVIFLDFCQLGCYPKKNLLRIRLAFFEGFSWKHWVRSSYSFCQGCKNP